MRALQAKEEVAPLERRIQRWHCGCNQRRMMQVVAPVYRSDAGELFAGEPKLEMRCSRCGARHAITREALEALVASEAEGAEKGEGGAWARSGGACGRGSWGRRRWRRRRRFWACSGWG